MARWRPFAIVLLLPIVAGCATGMRTGQLGQVSGDDHLVSLVVTDDLAVVRRECPIAVTTSAILGCQTSRELRLPGGRTARVVRIVRYSDRLPSSLAFEIDIHELCHAVAALQKIDDPCHAENGGVAHQYPSALPRGLLLR